LKDQEITHTDVVAWDGDGVWGVDGLSGGGTAGTDLGSGSSYGNVNFFSSSRMMVSVVML